MKIDGYVIVPPLNPWDEKNKDKIIPYVAYSTFDLTAPAAWRRFMGRYNDPDFSIKVQRYHDKGYRVKRATLDVQDGQSEF